MFENKTAIVTGAAKGIGFGIALELSKNKANVVLADTDESENYNAAVKIEEMTGFKTLAVKCDVSNRENVDGLIKETVEKFGGVDILVNNAGIYPSKPFMEIGDEEWDSVLNTNLKGVFMLSQAAAKVMKEGSKIVDISSIASLVGFEGLSHYCASKGGINSLVRAMAIELAHKKINVNVVAPGAIATPGADWESLSEEEIKHQISLIPWGRIGSAEDIANAVTFLCSPKSDYITGQVLVVDGGWTLK